MAGINCSVTTGNVAILWGLSRLDSKKLRLSSSAHAENVTKQQEGGSGEKRAVALNLV